MKNMRKLFAMVLAVMMVMSLATTVFADGTYTLTLDGAQAGHTYTAYQIFAGDLKDSTLSNIVWGSGVTAEGQTALCNAAKKAENLTAANIDAFAAEVASYLGTAAGSVTIAADATSGTIPNLEAGYYLVQTTATPDKDGVKTYYLMKVVKNTTATIKADVPEVDKEPEVTDANIGDTVTFTLTATMPSTLQGYETYKVIFHDTLSAGLDFVEGSVKVTVAGTDKTSAFTITESNGTLTISCTDVKAQGATASSQIVVTYDAILDFDAVIGTAGNPNDVYLEYSNDPNWDGEGDEPTGDTPKDEVKVYTWEIPVFKFHKEGEEKVALAGAGFTLYKNDVAVKLVDAGNGIYKVCNIPECAESHHVEDNEIVTGTSGKFEIEGLEKGTYVLKETTVPAGFNKGDDITVIIGDNGVLTVKETTVTTVEIENHAGSVLPETGGMGTTMFYLFGGVMVLAAVVLLVTKKRMAV